MEYVDLTRASEQLNTSRLHVLQIRGVVYVPGDVDVAKLDRQPDAEFRFQSLSRGLIRGISCLAVRVACERIEQGTATDLFMIIMLQISVDRQIGEIC